MEGCVEAGEGLLDLLQSNEFAGAFREIVLCEHASREVHLTCAVRNWLCNCPEEDVALAERVERSLDDAWRTPGMPPVTVESMSSWVDEGRMSAVELGLAMQFLCANNRCKIVMDIVTDAYGGAERTLCLLPPSQQSTVNDPFGDPVIRHDATIVSDLAATTVDCVSGLADTFARAKLPAVTCGRLPIVDRFAHSAFEECVCAGGLTSTGYDLHSADASLRIGTMVAANQGRPGGACGSWRRTGADKWVGEAQSLHANHNTQEEDVVSNWLLTAAHNALVPPARATEHCSSLFRNTIFEKWGFRPTTPTSVDTIQSVDFTTSTKARDYSRCWVVNNVQLSSKTSSGFEMSKQYPTSLFFVGGPNAGARGSCPESSTRRTFSSACEADYDLFYNSIKAALRAGLLAMAHEGCDVALLAGVSTGLYAGPHRQRIGADFAKLVKELLAEPMDSSTIKGEDEGPRFLEECFKRVIWTKVQ
jgi:hypothetical protein